MLVRRVIDETLDRVGDVGSARAAICRNRRRVGVREPAHRVHRRDTINAAHGDRDVVGRNDRPERAAVRAEIGAVVPPYREEFPVRIQRELAGERERAALAIAHERLCAAPDPLDRPPELARRDHRREVLRVRAPANAETAAYVLRNGHNLVLVEAGHVGKLGLHGSDTLHGNVKRVAAARLVECDETRARLEHVGDKALAVEA